MVTQNRDRDDQTPADGPDLGNQILFGMRIPIQKWTVGTTPITSLEFNPVGDRLAITSRNGYCLIIRLVLVRLALSPWAPD